MFDNETRKKRRTFWEYKCLNKAKQILYNCKKNPRRGIKSFFSKSFEKNIDKDQKNALLNAISLCNGRNTTIKLFKEKNIKPSDYPYNAKSEELEEKSELESKSDLESQSELESEFEESVAERTKMKRQNKSDKENQKGNT